jgi:hypothetical protein
MYAMTSKIWIAIAVIVIMILVYVVRARASDVNEYITGAWIAPDEFCEDAELDSLMIVFGDLTRESIFGGIKQPGYIVAMPNMINTGLTLRYSRGYSISPYKRVIHASVEFDDGALWGETNPTDIILDVDMSKGKMKIHDGDTVFAILYKSNDISDLIHEVEAVDD